ncbi:MAG: SulP family inorganic anion transporter, partial [Nitrospina sp.]|nr:SulP family inorganic anion transporter [Nitrospina sp.]
GTKTQISGPTGPMTVVMAVIIAAHADSPADVFAIVMLGGLFQILFGLLRLGQYVSYTPFSVVSGFMSGIGVIIILIQALPFLGHAAPSGPPVASVLALPGALADLNLHALILGAITLAIMVFWPARWQTRLPAPLLALTVCTALGHFVLTQAPTIGHVPTGLPALHLPNPAGFLGY